MVVYSDSDSFEVAFEDKYKKQQGVTAGFGDLVEVVMTDKMGLSGFVINPGVEEVLFGKDMVKLIAQQMGIGGDGTAKVGEPDKYPPELHGALTEYLKIEPSVSRIWVRLMRENGTDRISWLIIAETYMLDNMRKYCLPYLDNMDAYCASSKEEFASQVINGVKPFCEAE